MSFKNFISSGIIKWSLVVLISLSTFYVFKPFLIALVLGGIFSAVISPYYEKFILKFKFKRSYGASLFLIAFFIFAIIPFWAFVFRGVKLTLKLMNTHFPEYNLSNIPNMENKFSVDTAYIFLSDGLSLLGIDLESFRELLNSVGTKTLQFLFSILQDFLLQIPAISIFLIVILMTAYFSIVETPSLKKIFYKYSGLSASQCKKLTQTLQASSQSILLANIITGFIQALLVTIGSIATQIGDGWIVFFITFLSSFIPVGAGPIALGLSAIAFSSQLYLSGVALIVLAFVTGLVDNIIRPLLMRGGGNIHPFIAFLSVIGGVIGFGLSGLFLGPLIASLFIHCVPILVDESENKSNKDLS